MDTVSKVPTGWATKHAVPVKWMRQFRYLAWLYEKTQGVEGDVVECGLGDGNTFSMLAYLVGSEGQGRALWGFDSFEGWPEPTSWDASPRNPQKGEWTVSEEMIRRRLMESGVPEAYPNLPIQMVKGFLADTLPNFPDQPIKLLHIDVDLYPGYHDALVHLFPHVAPGGIVAFDEYKEFPKTPEYGDGTIEKWPGATRAIDEYFAGRPEVIEYHPETKKYYLVKK